jgi:hypothetical protein
METNYIFIGTYAIDRGGRYPLCYRAHICVLLTAHHDGDPTNEVRSIQTAIQKIEDAQQREWALSIAREYNIPQSEADNLVQHAHWLSTSLTPSLSGLKPD